MVDKKTATEDMTELGSTGLNRTGGYVHEEFLKELQGTRGVRVYREMSDNDPICGATLFAIEMLIRQVKWKVDAPSDAADVKNKAEFVEQCMHDMSMTWNETISEILSMLRYGWAYHEIVYKRRLGADKDGRYRSKFKDGLIGWRKLPLRAQETLLRWEFDDNGGVAAMLQMAPPDYLERRIPIEKALLFRPKVTKNNPEGRSILRNAYRPWYFKKHIENIEGIGIERDLAGLPVAMVPPKILSKSATLEEKATLAEIKKIVTNIRRDEQEGIVFPTVYNEQGKPMYELKLLTSGGQRQFNTDAVINRYNQNIAITTIADFILLGHEKVGSHSLASSKTSLFSQAIYSWVDAICSVFNRYAIPRLYEVNGWDQSDMVQLAHGEVEKIDLQVLGEYISKLAGAGAQLFPNMEVENYLREQAKIPLMKEETTPETNALSKETIAAIAEAVSGNKQKTEEE